VVTEAVIRGGETTIDVAYLPRGMYLLRVSVPEGNLVQRLVIE